MANWQTIEQLKDIFIRKYLHSELGSELEKACSEEYELKRDYNGRQILELLQNVDDAYVKTKDGIKNEVSVKIVFKDNVLEVGNTGTAFSQETIERLCLGRVSDKSSKNIGNKGTGFRALLNDAEWIEVHSGDFSIKFSEQYAKDQFERYANESYPSIYRQCQNWKKEYPLCFPIMNCPEQIEKRQSEFDTLIRVKIKDENRNKSVGILNQLKQPFYKSLLFLPNITNIEIVIDDEVKQFKKTYEGKQVYRLESQNTIDRYYVDEKEVCILESKVANLIIAVPLSADYDFLNEKLYCYFPIRDFKTPVNALIHAPFLTNNSRDDVPNDNDQINKRIFEECLIFLKEIAENICNDDNMAADLSIKTITPTNNFIGKVWDGDAFNLKSFYLQLLADAKLLPTVNGDYISISDKPKCINHDFPKDFKGGAFNDLLAPLPDNVCVFVKKLAYSAGYYELDYKAKELIERINQISSDVDVTACVEIFLWWDKRFYNEDSIPNLLKDTMGQWIQKGSKIYLPTDSGVSILPSSLSWVSLCILDRLYVDELIKQLKADYISRWDDAKSKLSSDSISNKRILDKVSDIYLSVKFIEQSNSDLIVEEINRQVDTSEKAIAFVNWFYSEYKDKLQENSTRYRLDYKLPDRNGNLRSTNLLYFGKEYGDGLSEKLFDKSKYFAVADLETLFHGYENEKAEIIIFLKRCGVCVYPKAYINSSLANDMSFVNYVKQQYNYDNNIYYISAMYIDGFEKTLAELDTKDVIRWITHDDDLCNLILSYEKSGYFSHKINSLRTPIYTNEYIRFALNRTKWIKIGDKKYSPSDIVKNAKLKDKIDGIYGIAEHELIALLDKQVVQEMRLDFVDSLAAFPDNVIKQILLKLPEFDKGEISRALYEDIIKRKKDCVPTYTIGGIKVLAKDGDYYENSTVRYADRKLPKAESEAARLIYIPTKRNTETIKNWLGVERYKVNLELVSSVDSACAVSFEHEISNVKIAALAILDETTNYITKIKGLKIIPCDRIIVKNVEKNGVEFDLDDYNYIKHEGKYRIKIPMDAPLKQIRESLDFRTSITEIFEDAVSPQIDANQFAYLLVSDENGKKDIITNQYGIDKWYTAYELLYRRQRVNDRIIKFFTVNNLDEHILRNIKRIDFSNDISFEEYSVFKEALTSIGKDIKDINENVELPRIDVRYCIKEDFARYRDSQVERYRISCYRNAQINTRLQESFLDDCNAFRCYSLDVDSIENTVNISYEEILKNKFDKFNPTIDVSGIHIDDTYNANYERIIKDCGRTRDELDLYLQTKPTVKSVLYFRVPENIREDIDNFIGQEISKESDTLPNEVLDGNGNGETTATVVTALMPTTAAPNSTPHVKAEKSRKQYEREAFNKENSGKRAEQIAYAELKKTYPNLIWHSKNSDIPADKNNGPIGIVCDMWNIDADKVKTYFEIKSATTEFEMSINEYTSMEAAPNDYEVVLVDIATKQISRHKLNELKDLKQVSKYRFCFTQTKK